MEKKLILTYAVLAYLKETSSSSNTSIFDIYIPIVKKGLSIYSEENNISQIMGRAFTEIKDKIYDVFGISIPIPVLAQILRRIEEQINDDNVFKINNDNSFIIKSYIFSDIDEIISTENEDIKYLETDFCNYCRENNSNITFDELINFIKAQEIDLFTSGKSAFLEADSILPQYLYTNIKNKGRIYQIICNLYLGSLLASYFELKLDNISNNIKFLIDTNFFISLIDLNTEDAYSVCNQVFALCKEMDGHFYILESTIKQINVLLNNRIQDFGCKDFIGTVKTADVFNACIRRNLQKTELEAIKDSVSRKLRDFHVETIYDVQIKDIIENAKKSEEFRSLRKKRSNDDSALNDVVAEFYVKKYRGNTITSFSDVKCWFLHNSYSPYEYTSNQRIYDRWSIGANELLVLLWLASPAQSNNIKTDILIKGGIATYITKYRRAKTPSTKILKEIKQKLDNAVSLGVVDEQTIYNLTIRMSEGSVDAQTTSDLETLQNGDFLAKLNEFKDLDKEKDKTIDALRQDLESLKEEGITQNEKIKQQDAIINRLSCIVENLENDKFAREKEAYVSNRMRKYKHYTIAYVGFILVVLVLYILNKGKFIIKEPWASIISCGLFVGTTIILNFINHTTIKDFFCRKKLRTRLEREFESNTKQ